MKPYCVKCPQAIMVVLFLAVILFAAIRISMTVGIVLAVIVLGPCAFKSVRRILFGRVFTTIAFFFCLAISALFVYSSSEPWYTVPTSEDEVSIWNGSWRRDPGGEKVLYSLYAAMFAAFAIMPWLPSSSRYYAEVKEKRDNGHRSQTTSDNLV